MRATVPSSPPSPMGRLLRRLPRLLQERLAQARRDVGALAGQLRGETPAPFLHRSGAARSTDTIAAVPGRPAALAGRAVRVDQVVRETADAVTLVLSDPTGAPFSFAPGQFFTVCVTVDGEALRRAYSASSAAHAGERLCLTVKRVPGGRVSTHLTERVQPGEVLTLLGPSGSFTASPDAAARRHLVLLAGGSGITPMMSLLRSLLPVEQETRIDLVYGNRSEADVIFAGALAELARVHGERFRLRHVLAAPPDAWAGGVGMLTRDVVAAELARLAPPPDAEYFVCGPEPMMAEARAALIGMNVHSDRIREERFTQPHLRSPSAREQPAGPQPLTVIAAGRRASAIVPPGDTLLEAGLAAGLSLPFSCAMGGCAACKVRLVEGEVDMDEPNCLGPDERSRGEILTCCTRPRGPVTVEVLS